jgi:hypothetical protein
MKNFFFDLKIFFYKNFNLEENFYENLIKKIHYKFLKNLNVEKNNLIGCGNSHCFVYCNNGYILIFFYLQ